MRTLVIGDIHGALKALEQVLDRAQASHNDIFILVGDYVDGWSESAGVISFLIEFSKTHKCIFLRGNHEELALDYFYGKNKNAMWLEHGGKSTVLSYQDISSEVKEQHLAFINSLENYYIDEQNRCFLHAGFAHIKGPQHEFYPHLVYWDRTLWEMACSLDPDLSLKAITYPKRLKLFAEIYIGHTPVTRIGKIVPTCFANVWNVDTGAAFKGPLSIIDIDTKQFWQSDPVHLLYPNEKGRN